MSHKIKKKSVTWSVYRCYMATNGLNLYLNLAWTIQDIELFFLRGLKVTRYQFSSLSFVSSLKTLQQQ